MLKATHQGFLKIGDRDLSCAVLDNGTRVITIKDVFKAFGRPARGSRGKEGTAIKLPSFMDAKNLTPFLPEGFEDVIKPVEYINKNGRPATGYKAEIIPFACELYLAARENNALTSTQLPVAMASEILVRSLSKVGIVALVDEATGYQEARQKDELQQLLSLFISDELMPWTKRFPDEFYKQLFRLQGWQFNPLSNKRPRLIGKLTRNIVYERLSREVLEELENKNPPNSSGNRRHRHHQFLTEDIGHPALDKHISGVIALMRASSTKAQFQRSLQRAYPLPEEQPTFDLDWDEE